MVNEDAMVRLGRQLANLYPKVPWKPEAIRKALGVVQDGHYYLRGPDGPFKAAIQKAGLEPEEVINGLDDFVGIITTASSAVGLAGAPRGVVEVKNLDAALELKCHEFPKCYRMANERLAEMLVTVSDLDLDSNARSRSRFDVMPPPGGDAAVSQRIQQVGRALQPRY